MLNKISKGSSLIAIAALTSGLLAFPTQSSAISFTGGSGAAAGNNNYGFGSLTIPAGSDVIQTLNSVTILGLSHVRYSDLTIYIERSGGSQITYLTQSGFSNPGVTVDSGNTYTFVPTGGLSWTTASNPVPTGNYSSSDGSFAPFDNTAAAGTYNLVVFNNAANGTASFTGFNIDVTLVPFEFEASAGVAILGGAWLLRKKLLNKKRSEESI